nr:GerMN domain-containing protein [Treponema sp.]
LKETAFFEKVFGSTPEFVENHEVEKPVVDEVPLKEDVTIRIEKVQPLPEPTESEEEDFITVQPEKENNVVEEVKKEDVKKPEVKKTENKKEEPKKAATSELELCFVLIDGDGSVLRKQIKRSVPKNDSPLTNAINLLLNGPDTTKAAEKNCMTLIPEGTRLISAKVQGGVAYLNFTEEFLFNGLGIDGQIHQLEQIVYTATAFPTVSSVQFMIEGKKQEYLSEGVWIGSPLSRANF